MTAEETWVEFDAPIEPLAWGRNVYTVIRLDERLVARAAQLRTRRVQGTLDEVQVNVGVNRADVLADAFMYVGQGLLRRLAAQPGDVVRCQLRPADPDAVPVADDVRQALEDAGRTPAFERRTPAERRRLLQPIEDAARPDTRHRRITRLIESLAAD